MTTNKHKAVIQTAWKRIKRPSRQTIQRILAKPGSGKTEAFSQHIKHMTTNNREPYNWKADNLIEAIHDNTGKKHRRTVRDNKAAVRVVTFLREHPGSTWGEIFEATGASTTAASRFLSHDGGNPDNRRYWVDENKVHWYFEMINLR